MTLLQAASKALPPSTRPAVRNFLARQLRTGALAILNRTPEWGLEVTLDMVLSHYRQARRTVRYLQIGAFDGISYDSVFPLVEKHGLIGILVEPQPEPFARLRANYACFDESAFTFVNAAIAATDGYIPLFTVKPEAKGPDWIHQIASFDRSVVMKHAGAIQDLASLIEIRHVPCITFQTLFENLGLDYVDFLQIDAEGYDAELLRLFDIPTRRPAIVRFEHKHLTRREHVGCVKLLAGSGYKVWFSPDDTLAYLCNQSVETNGHKSRYSS